MSLFVVAGNNNHNRLYWQVKGMNIGIVGPISKDRLILPDGKIVSRLGAVAYSALVLAKLLEGTDDSVVCLSHLAAEDIEEARALLDHPNIKMLAIDTAVTSGTMIELSHIGDQERFSKQMYIMTPISSKELALLANCDYLLLMPLNETDIPIEALREFRKSSQASIFLDVHGLITGLGATGTRHKQVWQHSEEWLNNIDFLKMNDKEAPWAAGCLLESEEDYADYAVGVVNRGLSACWITFGDQSSLVAWRRSGRVLWAKVPVVDVGQVIDTVGCGDSASAGFIYSYARLNNSLLAVILGNTFGSIKASLPASDEFPSKPAVRGMIFHHYRDYLHALLDELLTREHLIIHEVKEDYGDESSMLGANGYRYGHGTNNASGGDSQGSNAPRT